MRIQLDKNKFDAALSNRLEDRNKAEQYYKGILTDVTPAKIVGTAKSKYIRENYSLEDRDYFFTAFDNVEIGAQVAFDKKDYLVIEGLRINYCEFKSCQIQNIRFVKCSFVGCTFVKSFFNRVCFESCFFSIPFTEDGMMRPEDIRYAPTVFTDCYFIADFSNCDLDYACFQKNNLISSCFSFCKMDQALFALCSFSNVTIKDCKMQGLIVNDADVMEIVFSDELGSIVNEETFIDPYIHTSNSRGEIRTASNLLVENYAEMLLRKAKTLRAVANLFEGNNYSNLGGEYYYHSKLIERKSLPLGKRIFSNCVWVICGYGERPINTLICIAVSIILFAIAYLFTGFQIGQEIISLSKLIESNVEVMELAKAFGHSMFFSVTTFSTVGYGNYVPIGAMSLIISGVQMLVGVSLTALWTGCIFRKITR